METNTATAVVDGLAEGTASQESGSASQETNQTQETTDTKVESTDQQSSSNEQARPRNASYYSQKREFGRLRETIAEQQRQMQEMAKKMDSLGKPPTQKPDLPEYMRNPETFWSDWQTNLLRLKMEAKEEAKKEAAEEFQRVLPERYKEFRGAEDRERNMQEAMEMIFPNKANAKEPLEKRISSDPERAERILQILNETGLNTLSESRPVDAARFAIMAYEQERAKAAPRPAPNPNVLKKSLAGPMATGNKLTGGEKSMPTIEELRAERARLDDMVDKDPTLRYDEAFKQKQETLKQQYSARFKELRGDQKLI